MKYIVALVICFSFGSGALASAQNADLQNKDIVASRRQSTGATSTSRATGSTPPRYGAAKSSKLNQELGRIERESVKPGTGKPVRHASSHLPKSAEQDDKNTRPINFGHQHQTTRNKGSNNRGKK
jgi:hypothetical protein